MINKEIVQNYIEQNSIQYNNMCERAYVLHDIDVNQKYDGDKPYSVHLKGVVEIAKNNMHLIIESIDDIPVILFAAAFHDSIEDARLTYNDVMKIAKNYMDDNQAELATEIVYALTNEKGRNRAERANDKYYEGIRNVRYAPFVKMCDRIFNMNYSKSKQSSMYDKYVKEMPHFIEAINNVDSSTCLQVPVEMLKFVKNN